MTEAEWLACTEPVLMLEYLRGKSSDRKLRLFIAHGVRTLASLFGKEQEELSEMHERVADGQASEEDLERMLLRGMPELWEHRAPGGDLLPVWESARLAVRERFKLSPLETNEVVTPGSRAAENLSMCGELRCLFGNPFRPASFETAWLTWSGGTIPKLAQAIYADRSFDCLPVLADALAEAGCTDEALLTHCRGPGPHVRGCWVLDLMLGKD